jgi:hypothetical protein
MEFSDLSNGTIWIGRHAADGDTLVLDPALSAPASSLVSFFRLTQFRPRAFPHSVVQSQIREVTDPEQRALAEERYGSWPALKAEHDRSQDRARTETFARQREHIVARHRRFVESRGVAYQGIRDSSAAAGKPSARRQRSSCASCGIPLDDFVGARCVACSAVLCTCGACACVSARESV